MGMEASAVPFKQFQSTFVIEKHTKAQARTKFTLAWRHQTSKTTLTKEHLRRVARPIRPYTHVLTFASTKTFLSLFYYYYYICSLRYDQR